MGEDKTILIKSTDLHSIRHESSQPYHELKVYNYYLVDNKVIDEIENKNLPIKYTINKNGATLVWNDGTQTIIKRSNDDQYDKVKSFLWAYFQKHSGLSKTKANKYIKSLLDEDEQKILELLKTGELFNICADISDILSISFSNLSKNIKQNFKNRG